MRILFVNTFYYPDIIGGAEISIKKLAEGLVGKGNEVYVLTTSENEVREVINGVNIIRININNIYQPINSKNVNSINKLLYRTVDCYNLFNYNKLLNLIRKISPDIINVNNIYGISPIVYKIANELKIKTVATIRDYYLICPKVHMLKNGESCNSSNLLCNSYRLLNKSLLKNIDYVTAPSSYVIDRFKKEGFFINHNCKVIYNAIDINREDIKKIYKQKINKNRKCIKFLFLGSLEEHKGIKILLKAFNNIKKNNIRLMIAGNGDLKAIVEEYEKIDSRIEYLGFLNESEKEKILKESDILIAPSLWEEPFGRIVIEAYKYGNPVITSNKGGLNEIVDNYVTGLKVDEVSIESLKKSIEFFTENKLDSYIEAVFFKINEFTIERQVEEFNNLYKQLLK